LKEYKSVKEITGPLLIVEGVTNVGYNEIAEIELGNGEKRKGQVLEVFRDKAIIQVFEETQGLDIEKTIVRFKGRAFKLLVSEDMIGKFFNGFGEPLKEKIVPEEESDINGSPINPCAREYPKDFIETGISAIDAMNTLVRGQKLPIFSCSGLPHNQLATQVAIQSRAKKEDFIVILATMGLTHDEVRFFINRIEKAGSIDRMICFFNLASDPVIQRIVVPRVALTTAEFLAFKKGYHVLVLLTDITNYANALREVSAAREEVTGRRGYPPYLYTDLASIYERSGRIKGKKGSLTQFPILTMPEDDITHPIPDLSGYITEGQLIMDRSFQMKGIYPPINLLPSLSRLMNKGIGKEFTREDHKQVSDQIYACYGNTVKLRDLASIIGEGALTDTDKLYLKFGEELERKFINQGFDERRTIEETLEIAWDVLSVLPESELRRLEKVFVEKYGKSRSS